MSGREATRGQPLKVFAVILGVWLIGRVLLWESPFPLRAGPQATARHWLAERSPALPDGLARTARAAVENAPGRRDAAAPTAAFAKLAPPELLAGPDVPTTTRLDWLPLAASHDPGAPFVPAPAGRAAGHHMLLAAAFAHMALPPEIARFYAGRKARQTAPAQLAVADSPLLGGGAVRDGGGRERWSGDGWLLWRDGSAAPAAPGIAAYGRSQAGAVLRYRLAPASPARPTAYARLARTLEGPRQAEAAAGLSVRPLRGVPVRLAAEGRITDTVGRREIRPAAFVVTELAPVALPLDLRGEAYLQAGYVGGRDQTAFVDGQARVDHGIVRLGEDEELRAGLAAWGGAQKGAARLDVGPSATLGFRLGETYSRLAVDYRLRVAGDAAPASGPAVTFSAGF